MRLYLAGTYTIKIGYRHSGIFARLTPNEKACRDRFGHILESYHYIHRQRDVDMLRQDRERVFLDSGAFSAFTKGVTIDLPEYCEYIKRNQDIIEQEDGVLMASVLDGIGDPLATYRNQLDMERHGVRPLPCFHYGEDERYLEWYTAHYPYVTIGGMVPISTSQLYYWLDRIWEKYLIDGAGRAKLKIHGFGMTSPDLMQRYPWFSVDSSSWVQIASRGNIFLPGHGIIPVSKMSPKIKDANQHYDTLKVPYQDAVRAEVEKRGFEVLRLQEKYESRWMFNCDTYAELGRSIKNNTRIRDQIRLFD